MPWCPNCRYEYRPEIKVCPNCKVALVTKEPAAPPRVAGWRVEEKTTKYLRGFGSFTVDFRAGLEIARQAVKLTFRAKKLLLVVALLAAIYVVGEMVGVRMQLAKNPGAYEQLQNQPIAKTSWTARWAAVYYGHTRAPLSFIISSFDTPLWNATSAFTPEIGLLITSSGLEQKLSGPHDTWPDFILFSLFFLWIEVITLIISAALVVGLLGWIFSLARGTRPARWRDYLKRYYRPFFIFSFCVGFVGWLLFAMLQIPGLPLIWNKMSYSLHNTLNFITYTLLYGWIWRIVTLLLTFAPFAIVGLRLGPWAGAKAGVGIIWANRWRLLAVFVCYRIIYEIVFVLTRAIPETFYNKQLALAQPAMLPVSWGQTLIFTLLGLWLAMCFALLVKAEKVPAAAE